VLQYNANIWEITIDFQQKGRPFKDGLTRTCPVLQVKKIGYIKEKKKNRLRSILVRFLAVQERIDGTDLRLFIVGGLNGIIAVKILDGVNGVV
jgi:hypothetical protein